MATGTNNRKLCDACGKSKGVSRCEGCAKIFCYNHFGDHRQELNKQLDEVEVTRDLFRQTLTEQTAEPQRHALLQHINEWERDSMKKIRQTAEEARQIIVRHTAENNTAIEIKLNKLTDQLREGRQESDFIETDLHQWKEQLTQLTRELTKPSNITLRQDSKALVTKINVGVSTEITTDTSIKHVPSHSNGIRANTRWAQSGITVAGGNGKGNGLNQLSFPWGLHVDDDQTVYVADTSNHRIVEWKFGATSGRVIAGGYDSGNRNDQLNEPKDVIVDKESDSLIISDLGNQRVVRWPRRNGTTGEIIISNISCCGLAMDNDRCLYVSDIEKHEVRRWRLGDTNGIVVAGGNGKGNRLDQLKCPMYIFVDQDYSVYVSDEENHRVMKWVKDAQEGIVVAGGQGKGNSLAQFSGPRGVIVDHLDTVYVADYPNDRVMRWPKGATQGSVVIGGNAQRNQLYYPQDLSFDRQGNLYVVELGNDRVQRFDIN